MLPNGARSPATSWANGGLDGFGRGHVKEPVCHQSLHLGANRSYPDEIIPLDSKWCHDFGQDAYQSEISGR
jgi:hypothetical protein